MKAQLAFLHGRYPAVVFEREDGEGVDVHVLAINEVREQVEDEGDYTLVGSPFELSAESATAEPAAAGVEQPVAVGASPPAAPGP